MPVTKYKKLERWWIEMGGTLRPPYGGDSHVKWYTPSGRVAASSSVANGGKSDPNAERMIRGQLRRALRAEGYEL